MEHLDDIGTPSLLHCPVCGGTLWRINGARPVRFLCRTGHCPSLHSLQQAQALATSEALWRAIRAVREKRFLLEQTAENLQAEGDLAQALQALSEVKAIDQQEKVLRKLAGAPPR